MEKSQWSFKVWNQSIFATTNLITSNIKFIEDNKAAIVCVVGHLEKFAIEMKDLRNWNNGYTKCHRNLLYAL